MIRRKFITLLGGAAAWPLAARAQQPERMRRVGVLMGGPATDALSQAYAAAFVQALRQLGWIEGQNLRIDIRWNAGDTTLGQIYAVQLIGLQAEVILAATTPNLEVVRQATTTIPIVFTQVSDPIAQGFVASLTKPGGNLTGFSAYEFSIGGKWFDLLKEIAPGLASAGVLFNPDTAPQSNFFMRAVEAAASSHGVRAIAIPVRATADIEAAMMSFAREPNGGLILPPDAFTRLREQLIIELADRHRLPVISSDPEFPRIRGLMCYSVTINQLDQYRQAASYVDRILKGMKPGDLPIQQPDKYTLVINLKTAKALGLEVPPSLLAVADEVIE
jgi:putative tryptophan/tyrosine transport system substrate-binding protein